MRWLRSAPSKDRCQIQQLGSIFVFIIIKLIQLFQHSIVPHIDKSHAANLSFQHSLGVEGLIQVFKLRVEGNQMFLHEIHSILPIQSFKNVLFHQLSLYIILKPHMLNYKCN